MRYIKYSLACMLWLLLTACSHTPVEETRFVKYAETIPPITVPPGIKDPTGESYYPIPPIPLRAPLGTKPPLAPPGSQLAVQKKIHLPVPQ